jgi:hypothetical protein
MSLVDFLTKIEESELAMQIGATIWFPILESLHVLAVAWVFGAILMVDLRLLGVAAMRNSVKLLSDELTRWVWIGFVIALLTGVGLFTTRANHYVANVAFQYKCALLLLAGLNMMALRLGVWRRVHQWDCMAPPVLAKVAGAGSLVLWAGVITAGRWVGHLS